jgi:hypothetical protein
MKFNLDQIEKTTGPGRICGCTCNMSCFNSVTLREGLPIESLTNCCSDCINCLETEIVNGQDLSNKTEVLAAIKKNPNYHQQTHRRLTHGK